MYDQFGTLHRARRQKASDVHVLSHLSLVQALGQSAEGDGGEVVLEFSDPVRFGQFGSMVKDTLKNRNARRRVSNFLLGSQRAGNLDEVHSDLRSHRKICSVETELFGGSFGGSGFSSGDLLGFFLFNSLHHDGRSRFGMLRLDGEVTQDGVVETEAVFDFFNRLMAAFDVHENIVAQQPEMNLKKTRIP